LFLIQAEFRGRTEFWVTKIHLANAEEMKIALELKIDITGHFGFAVP
jgi:hypothetical protein